jgi:hypothetical protein
MTVTVFIPYSDYEPEGGQQTPWFSAEVEAGDPPSRAQALGLAQALCAEPGALMLSAAIVLKGSHTEAMI